MKNPHKLILRGEVKMNQKKQLQGHGYFRKKKWAKGLASGIVLGAVVITFAGATGVSADEPTTREAQTEVVTSQSESTNDNNAYAGQATSQLESQNISNMGIVPNTEMENYQELGGVALDNSSSILPEDLSVGDADRSLGLASNEGSLTQDSEPMSFESHQSYYAKEYEEYDKATEWEAVDRLDMTPAPKTYWYTETAHQEASAKIVRDDNSIVTATVTVEPAQGRYDYGTYFYKDSEGTMAREKDDPFAGITPNNEIPALGVIVNAASKEQLGITSDPKYLSFDGEYEVATLTISFSEEVTNPIIDIARVGGYIATSVTISGQTYWRGSFTNTKFELQADNVTFSKVTEGKNLTVTDKLITVTELKTNNSGEPGVQQKINVVSAGTGTVELTGTLTEVKIKLIAQYIPMSLFTDEGDAKRIDEGTDMRDGINGFHQSGENGYLLSGIGLAQNRPTSDAFLINIRLQKTGDVRIDYVDINGVSLKQQVIDLPPYTALGTYYDTKETDQERPEILEVDNKTYRLVPSGDYTVGKVGADGNLISTSSDLGVDPVSGIVEAGTKKVTYVYQEVVGEVVARYVIEGTETEIAAPTTVKASDTPVGEAYSDKAPITITKDGKTYELVAVRQQEGDAPQDGKVVEGKQTITYEYKEVLPVVGEVVARYVIEGTETEIAAPTTVKASDTPVGEVPVVQSSFLPLTGDETTPLNIIASLIGVLMFVLGILGIRKRKED